jgi:hypothetical protein
LQNLNSRIASARELASCFSFSCSIRNINHQLPCVDSLWLESNEQHKQLICQLEEMHIKNGGEQHYTTLLADVLLIAMLIVLTAGSLLSGILSKIDIEVIAQQKGEPSSLSSLNILTVQNTSMSKPAPNAPVNNQSIPHQIVVALPLREDGKIWTRMATFTASKPIEVEIVHNIIHKSCLILNMGRLITPNGLIIPLGSQYQP